MNSNQKYEYYTTEGVATLSDNKIIIITFMAIIFISDK